MLPLWSLDRGTGWATLGWLLLVLVQLWLFATLARSEAALRGSERRLRRRVGALTVDRDAAVAQSDTLRAALRHMNQGILMVGADRRVIVCNERAAALLDLPPALLAASPSFDELIAHQQARGEFVHPSSNVRAGSFDRVSAGPARYERVRPNGAVIEIQTVLPPEGGLVRTYTDVTERRRSQQQVEYLAHHDALTGLANRNAFHDRVEALIEERAQTAGSFAVCYIDLDGFKHVNDAHGHAVGDQLLAAVAARLRTAVRDGDLVARMGGDEFAVVQRFAGSEDEVAELAGRLLQSVSGPYRLGEIRCSVGVSIGVALHPAHASDPGMLLQRADMALHHAKAVGQGAFRVFDQAMDRELQSDHSLRQDLSAALANRELHLEYQPIVEAGSLAVTRFEALLRWTHPRRGAVPPSAFIPIAEQSGLIVPIGLWVLETACAAAAAWPVRAEVCVNLSPVQFTGGDLPEQVGQALLRTGLPPGQLNLEITEGVLLENTALVLDAMARLRALGIRFSLDDFGTAHAGLTYLRRFPFDVLKIDKSFVQGATQGGQARALLGAIRALGAACNLLVVAEGVETEAELAIVRDLGCDHVQGYLTGRPSMVARFQQASGTGPLLARPHLVGQG